MSDDNEKPDAATRFINTQAAIAEWESMKQRGVLYAAEEYVRSTMSRKERRAFDKKHGKNPYPRGAK